MIQFRGFRNTDPPALVEIWNESFTGRGAERLKNATLLEHCVFARPYFDPAGLILATENDRPVGFAHAGFGPNSAENGLSFDTGVVCAVAVRPTHRRQKIGSRLLTEAENYLRAFGVKQIVGGSVRPLNPFYFGLYGGADSPGFLTSDPAAGPFLEYHGYRGWATSVVLVRRLDLYPPVIDPRFVALRRRFDVQLVPQPEIGSWWQSCVMGVFEPVEFRLVDKLNGLSIARVQVWEMPVPRSQGHGAAGILDVQVRRDMRRQGLAKFLLSQMLRYIHEQYFRAAEVHIPEQNQPARALFQTLEFEQVDVGRAYRRSLDGSPLPPPPGQPVPA